jgi:WhiB family redox-sensing transcriptional regulator
MFPSYLARLLTEQPEWQEEAVCATVDPDLWHPEKGDAGAAAIAKRLCMDCPVRDQCLQDALDHDERYGVWGGLTARERYRLRPVEPSRLGKPRKDLTPEQGEIVAAMLDAGATRNQISVRTGMGHRAIDRFVAKLNQNGAAA